MTLSTLLTIIEDIESENSYFIYYDPQAKEANGYLRSFSLIAAHNGNKQITVVSKKAGNNCEIPVNLLSDSMHFSLVGSSLKPSELSVVHIDPELDASDGYVTNYLETHAPKVFLTGECDYVPSKWCDNGRDLLQRCTHPIQKYEKIFAIYLSESSLNEYKLDETKNLAFIQISKINSLLSNKITHSLFDLFDYQNPDLAPSPIWDIAIRIWKLQENNIVRKKSTFIFNALRPWIERNMDVSKLAEIIHELIKSANYSIDGICEKRNEMYQKGKYANHMPIMDIPSYLIKPDLSYYRGKNDY